MAPEHPVSLAAPTQRSSPLQLDFVTNPIQLALAVVEGEVLVKSPQHRREMRLLNRRFQCMCLLSHSWVRSRRSLQLSCGNAHHGELASAVHTARVLEAEEFERARLLLACDGPLSSKPPKQQQTGPLRFRLRLLRQGEVVGGVPGSSRMDVPTLLKLGACVLADRL